MNGWFAYKSKLGHTVTAMQVEGIYDTFLKFFKDVKFDQVIEIGTAQAGTTLIVRDALNEVGQKSCPLITYDPNTGTQSIDPYISLGQKITKYKENIFNTVMDELKEEASIHKYLNHSGKTLMICDGGCKFREFRVFAPLLKSGDFMMAHDYAYDKATFESEIKDKIWNWHEIEYANIAKQFEENNFEFYMQDEFAKKVWLCAKKQ